MKPTENDWEPDESWTSQQLEHWLQWAAKWRLIKKRYAIRNGLGDWEYSTTILGHLALHFLRLVKWLQRSLDPFKDTGESGETYDTER